MIARRVFATVLLPTCLVVVDTQSARAKPSVVSGIEIPFPVVDAVTGCASTGQVKVYPDVTPGLVATEKISATVTSPVCLANWEIFVTIGDYSPGFSFDYTSRGGSGTTASVSASQTVTYATAGTPTPNPVRGPGRVYFRIAWRGSNGVEGCIQNDWVVASYLEAYELGPVTPCPDDQIWLILGDPPAIR